MPESIYSVYLVQGSGEQGGKRQVTSPVGGHELEFYDTGVWLDRETGRNFFPYEQIRTIREHPEGGVETTGGTAETDSGSDAETAEGE
ncbi:hypothetical protein [Halorussus lipolyticus]|uniref:hypothetical protein n=1 Tax=Halorussus lipolyticus TaxID=3034024 RepID=UPI0023E7BD37|nr:hypothetical protein [Halorussus sp. DT80]